MDMVGGFNTSKNSKNHRPSSLYMMGVATKHRVLQLESPSDKDTKPNLPSAGLDLHSSSTILYPSPTSVSSQNGFGSFTTTGDVVSASNYPLSHANNCSSFLPRLTTLDHHQRHFLPTPATSQFHYPQTTSSVAQSLDEVKAQGYKYYQTTYGPYSKYLSPGQVRTAPYPITKCSRGSASPSSSQIYPEYAGSLHRYSLFENR